MHSDYTNKTNIFKAKLRNISYQITTLYIKCLTGALKEKTKQNLLDVAGII